MFDVKFSPYYIYIAFALAAQKVFFRTPMRGHPTAFEPLIPMETGERRGSAHRKRGNATRQMTKQTSEKAKASSTDFRLQS